MTVRNVSQGNTPQFNVSMPKETTKQKQDETIEVVEQTPAVTSSEMTSDKAIEATIDEVKNEYIPTTVDELNELYKTDFDDKISDDVKKLVDYNAKSFDYDDIDSDNELSDLTKEKTNIENNIAKCHDDINLVNNGTSDALKEYQKTYEDAQLNYEKALDESTNPAVVALKDEINQVNENIALQKTVVDFYATQISQTDSVLSEQKGNLEGIKSEISIYSSQASSLKNAIANCNNEAQKSKLQSRLSSLQGLIGNAQARQTSQEAVIKTLEERLNQLKEEEPEAQNLYDEFEKNALELEQKLLETKDEAIVNALNNFNEAKEAFNVKQQELLEELNTNLSELTEKLQSTQEEITALKEELFEQQMEQENSLDVKDQPDEIAPMAYPSSKGATGSNGYSGSGLNKAGVNVTPQITKETLKENSDKAKEELKEDKQARNNIFLGNDEDLSALKKVNEADFEKFNDALSEKNPTLASEIASLKENLSTQEGEIDAIDLQINEYEDELKSLKQELNGVTITLSALNSQLEALEKMDTSKFDSEKLEQFEKNKASLKGEISAQESLKQSLEEEIKEKEEGEDYEEYVALKKERTEKKKEYDKTYNELQSKITEAKNSYPDLDNVANKYLDSLDNYSDKKEAKILELQGNVQTAQAKADEAYLEYMETEAIDKAREFKFASFDGEAIIDFAKTFLGCKEADGSANKFVNGASSAQIPWCAAYVSYVMQNSPEYDDVASWYKNIGNKWYCPTIHSAAKEANAIIPLQSVQAGDMVLFDWESDGKRDHIGIVTSVDKDGTVHTIEGNTSNTVAERTYNPNKTNMIFCKTFD